MFRQLESGGIHTCGVTQDNKVWCWGRNTEGQLGNGTNTDSDVPVQVSQSGTSSLTGKTVSQIWAGYYGTCARATDYTLHCWGRGDRGQLGNNALTNRNVPVAVTMSGVLSSKYVVDMSIGPFHVCARTSENLAYCWGYNSAGQLGNSSTTQSPVPVAVNAVSGQSSTFGKAVVKIAVGNIHTCAVTSDGIGHCWGSNVYGMLGSGASTATTRTTPSSITMTGAIANRKLIDISAGAGHVCALASDSAMFCWGRNQLGQLGNSSNVGTDTANLSPLVVSAGSRSGKTLIQLVTHDYTNCARASDNTVHCWGNNQQRQLGNASTATYSYPPLLAQTSTSGVTIQQLSIGVAHSCVMGTNGQIWCWGANSNGQRTGTAGTSPTPTVAATSSIPLVGGVTGVTFGGTAATSVKVVDNYTVTAVVPARATSGAVDVVVTNSEGSATMAGGYTYRDMPTITGVDPAQGPTAGGTSVAITGSGFYQGIEFKTIKGGSNFDCGLARSNKIYCWGNNLSGQLGVDPAVTTQSATPVPIATGSLASKTIKDISAGLGYVCALATDSTIHCWGNNSVAQLGRDPTSMGSSFTPVQVPTGSIGTRTVSQISTMAGGACALASDSTIHCWGRNRYGEMGNNINIGSTTTYQTSPAPASTYGILGRKVIELTSGELNTCARLDDNTFYCWGYNIYGNAGGYNVGNQLGAGFPSLPNPGTFATNSRTLANVSLGRDFTCARAIDNTIGCWGQNSKGQLGSTTNSGVSAANATALVVQVGSRTGKSLAEMQSYYDSTCVRATDSTVHCWGSNKYGQLGNAVNYGVVGVGSNTPVLVTTGTFAGKSLEKLSSGTYFNTCVLATDSTAHCWGRGDNGQKGDGTTASSATPTQVDHLSQPTNVVRFGTNSATSFTVNSPTSITAVSPAGTGVVDIRVINPDGQISTAVAADHYTYTDGATLTSISPDTITADVGGTTVTVTGEGFISGATLSVDVAGTVVTGTYISPTQISFVAPALARGSKDIIVTQNGFASNTLTGALTYVSPAPTVTNVSPNIGPTAGGQNVTVTGTGFFNTQPFTSVVGGNNYTCGIDAGKAYCWGTNDMGQLGDGTTTTRPLPTAVDTSTGSALAGQVVTKLVSGGNNHTCALTQSGTIACWGLNDYGQLGDGTTTSSLVPVVVQMTGALAGKTIDTIQAGGKFTCAILTDGNGACWGLNVSGQLGNETNSDTENPNTVPLAINTDTGSGLEGKTILKMAPGRDYNCVIASDQQMYCWGNNYYGTLGYDADVDVPGIDHWQPTAVDSSGALAGKSFADIASSYYHTCAVAASGETYCWGLNYYGQLGNTTNVGQHVGNWQAMQVGGPLTTTTVQSVAVGVEHTCATTSGNQVYCWGNNRYGQLGDTTSSGIDQANPNPTSAVMSSGPLAGQTITSLTAGYYHTCATLSTEQTYCWGRNNVGQLGTTTNYATDTANPTPLPVGSALAVDFGGVYVDPLTISYLSATQLQVTTPPHLIGTVTVRVTNPDGQSSANNGMLDDYTYVDPPAAPTSLTAVPRDDAVQLNWTAPATDGGSPITDYVVQYSPDGGTTWNTFADGTNTNTTTTVTGLTSGVTYQFRVAAVNAAGQSAWSNVASSQTLYVTISATGPVSFAVTPTAGGRVSTSSHTVGVSTNSTTGYAMSLAMQGASASLVRSGGSETIDPTPGTPTLPSAFSANTWGFRVDGLAAFGTGTTVETDVATSAYTWASVPAGGSGVTIRTYPSPVTDNGTTVCYGMNATTARPSGTYTGTVVYTAIAN